MIEMSTRRGKNPGIYSCVACGHAKAERHHLVSFEHFGELGERYVTYLCPNCHECFHHLWRVPNPTIDEMMGSEEWGGPLKTLHEIWCKWIGPYWDYQPLSKVVSLVDRACDLTARRAEFEKKHLTTDSREADLRRDVLTEQIIECRHRKNTWVFRTNFYLEHRTA